MKKKQSLSILLLLLFSMVLGISSRSYCKVTEAQFKNFLYNNEIRNGKSEEQAQAEMQLPIVNEMLEDISQYLNNDNYKIFICSAGYNVYFYEKIASDTNYITVRNNSDIDVTLNGYSNGYQININSNFYSTTSSQYYNNLRNNMVYSEERLVYNGSTWANAPYYRPNQDILSGPYVDDLFVIDSSAYCGEEISISNNLEIEEGFYTFDKQNFNRNIASIYQTGDYLLGVYLNQYYYDKNANLWKVLFTDTINSYEQDSINYLETLVFLEDINKVPNTMVEIIPLIKDANMPCIPGQEYFYLTDSFSVITDNALDIDNTFSGDYYESYKNNIADIIKRNQLNNIPKEVGETFYKSGEDKGIIQKVYEDLFTIASGEAEAKIQSLYEELELPSGETEIAKAGLNLITNNATDFIISWPRTQTHFTIAGEELNNQLSFESSSEELGGANQINFSKIERDNEEFQQVMRYARAIIGFSIIALITKNFWNTLLQTLGIGTQIYEKSTEEKEIAKGKGSEVKK